MYKLFLAIIVLAVIPIMPGRASYGSSYPWLLTLEPTLGRVLDPPLITIEHLPYNDEGSRPLDKIKIT